MSATTDADILNEVVSFGDARLAPETARAIMRWKFSDRAVERMRELALKANSGSLSGEESAELESYRRVGLLVDVARAKAASVLAD